MEWSVVPSVFATINDIFGPFDIDLFASASNHKCECYASFTPDHRLMLSMLFPQHGVTFLVTYSALSAC